MALRYWTGNATPTSSNWNYNSGGITNWGSASGVADNASVPTSVDDVIFDGVGTNGNANNIISSSITVLSLTFTSGYTATATINSNVTLTIAGNFTDNIGHTWIVGNISTSILQISAVSTINSGGKIFPGRVDFSNTNTKTLIVDWTILGSLNCVSNNTTTTLNQTGTNMIYCGGLSLTFNATLTGNAGIRTSGNVSFGGGGTCNLFIRILELAGNLTISGNGFWGNSISIKYISGTVTSTYSPIIYLGGVVFDTFPINWPNITLGGAGTFTLNSLLLVSGTLTLDYGSNTFLGTAGFTVGTLTTSSTILNNINFIFNTGNTYTITSSLYAVGTLSNPTVFRSIDAVSRVNFVLNNGASCTSNINFTRIDASGGRPINAWNGTITDCINVRSFTDLRTVSTGFIT